MEKYCFPCEPLAPPAAIVQGKCYRFTVLSDRVLRCEWAEDGAFEDRASTFAINRHFPVPKFRVKDSDGQLEILTEHMHLTYDKKRFSSIGLTATFHHRTVLWGAQWRFDADVKGNLGGTVRTLDEVDGRCDLGSGVLSTAGFSFLDDSKSMLFDGHGFVAPRKAGDRLDGYLFNYGLDFKAGMEAFFAISGPQPLLPRWALGNWWSRYHAYSAEEYLDLLNKFVEHHVPLSVAVIDMDWHLVKEKHLLHSGWTGYTWNKKLFPDPSAFGRELHRRKLKITLNDHPHSGIAAHEEAYEDIAKALDFDTSNRDPIPFDPTDPRFMYVYLNKLHRDLEAIACDFWWIDWQQGTESRVKGIDPLWLLNHFHFLDNAVINKNPLIFSRYAGPGSHRYPVGFSGDTVTTWASLQFQPELTSTASNIGFGWWSHDIGGHMHGGRDDELVTRWVQFGVFSPIMRLHSTNSQWMSKEPWQYREECRKVIETFMQYRHRLVPYLYTMNVLAATAAEPLVKPMYWSYPSRREAYRVPNQYSFGTQIVCAPIVQPREKRTNLASVQVWVPPRRHVDIFTGIVYSGGREMKMYRPLHLLPVLAPEGAILPLDGTTTPANGCINPSAFEILVVVGHDGDFVMVEDEEDDDDRSPGINNVIEGSRSTAMHYRQSSGTFTMNVAGGEWAVRFLALAQSSIPVTARVNGNEDDSIIISNSVWPDVPSTLVQFPPLKAGKHSLTIDLGSEPKLAAPHLPIHLRSLIADFQIDFGLKDRLWDICVENRGVAIKVAAIMALNDDESIYGPLVELLCSEES